MLPSIEAASIHVPNCNIALSPSVKVGSGGLQSLRSLALGVGVTTCDLSLGNNGRRPLGRESDES
jgi:hypothetical protein